MTRTAEEIALFVLGLLFVVVSVAALMWASRLDADESDRYRTLDRACTLAAGNVRATLPWLAPDHPRREAGLLLLARDAAWAPVCARDRDAGDGLRSQVDTVLGQPDAPGARDLAAQLVILLETR